MGWESEHSRAALKREHSKAIAKTLDSESKRGWFCDVRMTASNELNVTRHDNCTVGMHAGDCLRGPMRDIVPCRIGGVHTDLLPDRHLCVSEFWRALYFCVSEERSIGMQAEALTSF
jgi:hypothetical protein